MIFIMKIHFKKNRQNTILGLKTFQKCANQVAIFKLTLQDCGHNGRVCLGQVDWGREKGNGVATQFYGLKTMYIASLHERTDHTTKVLILSLGTI